MLLGIGTGLETTTTFQNEYQMVIWLKTHLLSGPTYTNCPIKSEIKNSYNCLFCFVLIFY